MNAKMADGFTLQAAFTIPESANASTATEKGILNAAGSGKGVGITYEKYNFNTVSFCFRDTAGYQYIDSGTLNVGELYVFTCVYDASTNKAQLYVNGKLANEKTVAAYTNCVNPFYMGSSANGNNACQPNFYSMVQLLSEPMSAKDVADSYNDYVSGLEKVRVNSGTGDIYDLRFENGAITSASNMFGDADISVHGGKVGTIAVRYNGAYYHTTGYERSASSQYAQVDLSSGKTAISEAMKTGFTMETAFTIPKSAGSEVGILNGCYRGGAGITYEKYAGKLSLCMFGNSGSYFYASAGDLAQDELYVVTCTYDPDTKESTLYINGEYADKITDTTINMGTFYANWFLGASPNGGDACKAYSNANTFTMARMYSSTMSAQDVEASFDAYIAELTVESNRMAEPTVDMFDLSFDGGTITSAEDDFGEVTIGGSGGEVGTVVVHHGDKYYETSGFTRQFSGDYRSIGLPRGENDANRTAVYEAINDGFTMEVALTIPESTNPSSASEVGILNGCLQGGMGISYEKPTSGGGGGLNNLSFCFRENNNYKYVNSGRLNPGEMYVATCVYDVVLKEARLYINGELADTMENVSCIDRGNFYGTWAMGASLADNSGGIKANAEPNIFTMARLYSEPMVAAQVSASYRDYIGGLQEVLPDASFQEAVCLNANEGIVEVHFDRAIHVLDQDAVVLCEETDTLGAEGVSASSIQYLNPETIDGKEYSTALRIAFPAEIYEGAQIRIVDPIDGAVNDNKIDPSVVIGTLGNQLKADHSADGVDYLCITFDYHSAGATLVSAEPLNDRKVKLTFSDPVSILNAENIFVSNSFDETVLYHTPGKVVNVLDYGATPDDATDDVQALQNAVDAVKDGGIVYFPAGNYRLTKALVFYSNQTLYFEEGATLLRGSSTLTYLLANHTVGTETGYSATENVNIIGATSDGGEDIDYKITMMNTGHCRNLNLLNCTFRNGDDWHYYECNSSENILIDGCVFENSYGVYRSNGTSEYLQFDWAASGVYGIVQSVYGAENFKFDNTVCRNITVRNCTFDCSSRKCIAVGDHSYAAHYNIKFYNNVFIGGNETRGLINFYAEAYDFTFSNNVFEDNAKAITIAVSGNKKSTAYTSNTFTNITTPVSGSVELVDGEGDYAPVSTAVYTFAKAVTYVDGTEIGGDTYATQVIVEFSERLDLDNIAGIAVLVGNVKDANGTLSQPNVYAENEYIVLMSEVRGNNPGGSSSGNTYYTLAFETNGGSKISTVSKVSGSTIALADYKPTREGYTFGGWYSDSGLTEKVASVKLTKNTTVYAKWTENVADMPFTDVPTDAYYADAVLWAVENGVTTGTSATTFNPNGICTRAQAVTFLWRASGSPEPSAKTCPFTDVSESAYYYKAVLWAVEQGITKGTSEITFGPDMNCTRAQIVTFQYRAKKTSATGNTNPFTDVANTAYYADAVLWAVKEGVTNGTSATTFSPNANCTRAQIVTFMWRDMVK